MSDRREVASVVRALAIIEMVGASELPATLTDIVIAVGLPTTTVHRLCATLVANDCLRQDSTRRYLLGPAMVSFGRSASENTTQWASPVLAKIVHDTGETVNLAAPCADAVIYLAQVPSPHSMRMFTEVGRRVDIHCTAVGKALVSSWTDDEIRTLFERVPPRRYTEATITDVGEFIEHIHLVRSRGYATDESEKEEGVRCVAVATLHRPRMAISVSGPDARFTPERRDAAVQVIRQYMRELY